MLTVFMLLLRVVTVCFATPPVAMNMLVGLAVADLSRFFIRLAYTLHTAEPTRR